MKKVILLFLSTLLFVGCSSNGSREIQIDEVEFIPGSTWAKEESIKKVSSIFEVVPGKYEIAWKVVDNLPQQKNLDLSLKLKLRLKNSVDVKQEVFDKLSDPEIKFASIPFNFELTDANGALSSDGVSGIITGFGIASLPLQEMRKKSVFDDIDKAMDFFRFLKSKPGTEIEVEMHSTGLISQIVNCVDGIKNAKGMICTVEFSDKDFEDRIGNIID